MKYFEINDAEKPIKLRGFTVEFRQVEPVQGEMFGILSVADPDAAKALESDEARKLGVRPMSHSDDEKKARNKTQTSANIPAIPSRPPRPPQREQAEGKVVADDVDAEKSEEKVDVSGLDLSDVLTPRGEDGTEEVAKSDDEIEAEAIRNRLRELGEKNVHPNTGLEKLRERLTLAEAKNSGGADSK